MRRHQRDQYGMATPRPSATYQCSLAFVLACALTLIACATSAQQPDLKTRTPIATFTASTSPTISVDAVSRIHNASPTYVPLFASIQFAPVTTYEQAVAIIGGAPYPWSCDGVPRTPEPTPQSAFATRHYLLLSYPTWDRLLHIASSPQVVSVDGTPLYPCP
jgi:hypothetical protein